MAVPKELIRAGFSANVVEPFGTGANGVMVVAEAPGQWEDEYGVPLHTSGDSGAVFNRALRRVGMNREQFVICNTVPARPPNNWLEKAPWEADAIAWGKELLQQAMVAYRPRTILALGAVATRVTTGLAGPKLGMGHLTGYVLPGMRECTYHVLGAPVVPCFHPAYIRRGKMSHLSVLMRCLRLACSHPKAQTPPVDSPPTGYIMHPTLEQVKYYLYRENIRPWLAYDIETFYSNSEEEAEEHTGEIKSIQFSWAPGEGIFIPWREPYLAEIRMALASENQKVGWNNWRFDDPVLRANGMAINGKVHDLMWAWHHLQPDLPRGLQFAAAMQGPTITNPTHVWSWPWKHLDAAAPEFYGIVDVDVLQWMLNY